MLDTYADAGQDGWVRAIRPSANLSWLSLWRAQSCRTHSLFHFFWSCPDTRLRWSPWTTSPAHWHNTPLTEESNRGERDSEVAETSTMASSEAEVRLTACTELQSRLVSRYRRARFSSSLSFESAWWEHVLTHSQSGSKDLCRYEWCKKEKSFLDRGD